MLPETAKSPLLFQPSSFAGYAVIIGIVAPYIEQALHSGTLPGILLALASAAVAVLKTEG